MPPPDRDRSPSGPNVSLPKEERQLPRSSARADIGWVVSVVSGSKLECGCNMFPFELSHYHQHHPTLGNYASGQPRIVTRHLPQKPPLLQHPAAISLLDLLTLYVSYGKYDPKTTVGSTMRGRKDTVPRTILAMLRARYETPPIRSSISNARQNSLQHTSSLPRTDPQVQILVDLAS